MFKPELSRLIKTDMWTFKSVQTASTFDFFQKKKKQVWVILQNDPVAIMRGK